MTTTITDMEIRAAVRQIVKECGSVDAVDTFIRAGEYSAVLKQRALDLLHEAEMNRDAAMAVDGDVDDISWA